MAFIGESRKDSDHPWLFYVCLEERDIQLIGKSVFRLMRNAQKKVEKYKDILDGGEATEQQEDELMKAIEEEEAIASIHGCIARIRQKY